jgi:hypothetical protein
MLTTVLPLLQKQFLVSAGNLFLVLASKSDTLCVIQKNGLSLVSAAVDRHQTSYIWCRLLMSADTKNQFSVIKNTQAQI